MAASPASSPRLPSPPPIAEDQIGPKSPLTSDMDDHGKLELPENFNQGASRRIRPGTKSADMPEGPPLMELTEIDSPFQLTEHLKALYNAAIHHNNSNTTTPIDRETAIRLSQPPDGVDRALWLYELCRFLCQKVNTIIVALFADNPPCSAQTCNEMRASEWQYLCAVHDPPKPCCAIDYCCHTLDWAANILTSPKQFPSRLALGTEPATAHQQLRQLTNIFRRVYRIFAHAWFQHRDMFWKVEGQTGLYVFFKTVCDVYGLIPEENYTVPPEAEGIESSQKEKHEPLRRPAILRHTDSEPRPTEQTEGIPAEVPANVTTSSGATTKRHRHAASTDGTSIITVIEEAEEEDKPPETAVEGARSLEDHLPERKPEEVKPEAVKPEDEKPKAGKPEDAEPISTETKAEAATATDNSAAQSSEEHEAEEAANKINDEHAEAQVVVEDSAEVHSEGSSSGGQHTPPDSETEDHVEPVTKPEPEHVEVTPAEPAVQAKEE